MIGLFLSILFLPLIVSYCPKNTIKWPNDSPAKCYSFLNVLTSFQKAELACNYIGGHLTSVHEGFTNSFLSDHANTTFTGSATSDFWIGAKKSTNTNKWTWTDGTTFDYTEWQNSGSENSEACAAPIIATGRWNARDCGQLKPYVCETDELFIQSTPTNTKIPTTTSSAATTQPLQNCSYPWQYFDNSCYYWADNSNWQKGEDFCVKQNSHMVSIHSKDEIAFIKSIHNEDFWTGLYSNDNPIDWNSNWQYTDSSTVDYISWVDPFYPSHNGFKCVRTSGIQFTNIDCSTVLTVFCKKASNNAIITTPSVITTPKPNGNCLNGWSYNSKTQFCYFVTYAGNFSTMEDYCKTFKNGHLSSFHDADEFSYLNSLAHVQGNYNRWVGLYSDDNAMSWQFTDGTPFDYRPWASGYPQRNQNACASSYSYYLQLWNAYPCSSEFSGVCKMPPLFF
uniref:C-type lectin domain-containing protein n=1 Tax=Panagrolaimus sp. ES5 TaxID=591445 RepID=A0AC34FQC9_9BILA